MRHVHFFNGGKRRLLTAAALLACAGAIVALFPPDAVFAQTPDQLQQLQQQLQGPRTTTLDAAPAVPQNVVIQPVVPQTGPASPPSRLEQIMSSRAGVQLHQFGYDQFGVGGSVTVPQTGAVQDDYVLGPGDEVVVSLRGQENNDFRLLVDRNGQISLPRLSPISAAGRTFGSFRQDIASAVGRAYVATNAFVSVGRMRQISVLVTGGVNNPGQRLMTGLSSVLDALLVSGGVAKTGSLRDVRVIRGGRQYNFDLYGMLAGTGTSSGMRLADGDRIFVAPLGRTVAVAGLVRNPGIYELPPSQTSISSQTLVNLAGGKEINGNYLFSILRLQPDGRTVLQTLKSLAEPVADGEILVLQLQADQTTARATLGGGTALAGSYPVVNGTKLSTIIRLPGALGVSPYTLFGLLARRDPKTLLRTLTVFTPSAVLNGGEDLILQSDDLIRVISVDEMRMMVRTVQDYEQMRLSQDELLRNPSIDTSDNAGVAKDRTAAGASFGGLGANASMATVPTALEAASRSQQAASQSLESNAQALATRKMDLVAVSGQAGAAVSPPSFVPPPNFQVQTSSPGTYAQNREAMTFGNIAQQLGIDPLVLTNFLIDHMASIEGAVRGPGDYFVGPSTTLQDVVLAAGGTLNWADNSGVELISTIVEPANGHSVSSVTKLPLTSANLASYVVRPHDSFRFNKVFADVDVGSVTLQGEVRFTGTFKLTRGERLSDVLARAGGLTNVAYPYGTIFLRRSAAVREREGYNRTAKEVEDQLIVAMTRVGNNRLDPAVFAAMQTFVSDLRNQKAIGRIVVSADPSVLAANPGQDPLLEAGDVIYIPQRPATVSILGEVMQPTSVPYQPGSSIVDYIERAGGYSSLADQGQTFVVYPDGTARKLEKAWFRLGPSTALPPGSTIVVPRDVTPLDLRQTVIDVTQVLSQLAVSIASVAVLSKQ